MFSNNTENLESDSPKSLTCTQIKLNICSFLFPQDLLMVITLSQLVKTQLQLNEKLTLLTTL
jgi:hypothetical protein